MVAWSWFFGQKYESWAVFCRFLLRKNDKMAELFKKWWVAAWLRAEPLKKLMDVKMIGVKIIK